MWWALAAALPCPGWWTDLTARVPSVRGAAPRPAWQRHLAIAVAVRAQRLDRRHELVHAARQVDGQAVDLAGQPVVRSLQARLPRLGRHEERVTSSPCSGGCDAALACSGAAVGGRPLAAAACAAIAACGVARESWWAMPEGLPPPPPSWLPDSCWSS
eukprot:363740-Chlamydomonas_euryale.AAC.37